MEGMAAARGRRMSVSHDITPRCASVVRSSGRWAEQPFPQMQPQEALYGLLPVLRCTQHISRHAPDQKGTRRSCQLMCVASRIVGFMLEYLAAVSWSPSPWHPRWQTEYGSTAGTFQRVSEHFQKSASVL